MAERNVFEFRNLRTAEGDESPMFSASLYRDGRKIGRVRDTGTGGEPFVEIATKSDRDAFARWAKETASAEALEHPKYAAQWAREEAVGRLYEAAMEKRWLKRHCKTKTLFRPADHGDDASWMTINHRFDERVKAFIVQKYGADVRIANEEI